MKKPHRAPNGTKLGKTPALWIEGGRYRVGRREKGPEKVDRRWKSRQECREEGETKCCGGNKISMRR